jgi:hypothetical protein
MPSIVFGQRNLEKTPTLSIDSPGTWIKDTRPMSPASQAKCDELMERIRQYVRHHGCDVKSWYHDFDKHNSGFVTVNQFLRAFPPNLLSADDIELIMDVYKDSRTETINYFKFNVQVNRKRTCGGFNSGAIKHSAILKSRRLMASKLL